MHQICFRPGLCQGPPLGLTTLSQTPYTAGEGDTHVTHSTSLTPSASQFRPNQSPQYKFLATLLHATHPLSKNSDYATDDEYCTLVSTETEPILDF